MFRIYWLNWSWSCGGGSWRTAGRPEPLLSAANITRWLGDGIYKRHLYLPSCQNKNTTHSIKTHFILFKKSRSKHQLERLPPLGLLACADVMFWVSILSRSSRSSCSLRYNSLHDSYSCGDARLKSRAQWRIHSSSESSVKHWKKMRAEKCQLFVPCKVNNN